MKTSSLKLAAFAVLALFGALCSASNGQAQTAVTIGTAKDPNVAAQIAIAREKGYFKQAGLDAKISEFQSGGDLMAAFVGGSVQMGSAGTTPVIILRSRPYPVVIVARVSDISGVQQLIVQANINKLEGLYGKKVGVMKGTDSEAFFNAVVKNYGLDVGKMTQVNLDPTEMIQAFVQREVSAVAVWEPHATRARELGKGKTLISGTKSFVPGKEGPKRIFGGHAVLFASEDFVSKHGDTVKKVLTALHEANDFIASHHDEAISILAKAFSLTPKEMSEIAERNNYTLNLDQQMIHDLKASSEFLVSSGKVPSAVDVAAAIDPAPLRDLNPDLVKLK